MSTIRAFGAAGLGVRVDFTDDAGNAETLTSAAFGPIAPGGI